MTDHDHNGSYGAVAPESTMLEFGGLRFDVSFRGRGATLRVDGSIDGAWTEMLRFDDFIDEPHFHAPASESQIDFDRASLGEPLAWYIDQIQNHLSEWLTKAGFSELLPTIDFAAISSNADKLTTAMEECVPEGYVRVPGIGIQREASAI